MLLSRCKIYRGDYHQKNVLDLIGLTDELGAGVRAKAQDDFLAIGLLLKSFFIGNLKPSDKSAKELREMGMLDMQTYTRFKLLMPLRDAARTLLVERVSRLVLALARGIGNVLSGSLAAMTQGQGQSQTSTYCSCS